MSASQKLSIGVAAAGMACILWLSHATAQQGQAAGQSQAGQSSGSDQNTAGQSDRSASQQSDRSATRGDRNDSESGVQRTANHRGTRATAGGQSQVVDRYLASCLLARNEAEVQLSEIALKKSENAEVKQFAQKMIQDHRKMIEQLQPLAGMQGGNKSSTSSTFGTQSESLGRSDATEGRTSDTKALPGSSGAGQTSSPTGTATAAPRSDVSTDTSIATANATKNEHMAGAGGAVHQLMQIDRQIGERCLQMARDDLQQKSGAEFDKCYVGNAIDAHIHALAALEVIGQQTQGQLAQVAQQAQPNVQQHLEQAKQLVKQLEGQSGASGSQAERRSTRTE